MVTPFLDTAWASACIASVFVFTALSSDEKAVCLSVCLSNAWIVTKQKNVLPRFLHYTKDYLA